MTALAACITQAYAQTPQTIEVTGFRGSLETSANAKREAIGITDSVFAEDMGKFPEANIAESLARIPGVQLTREISGEGLQISVRGLGSSFTRVLLNGAPVASASTGRTDAQSANREVDLDFLPTELITQLTVAKSPSAILLEGGIAGVVNMRSARPFDKKGRRVSGGLQFTRNDPAGKWGHKGSVLGSTTFGDTFGVLGGVAWSQNKVRTTGFETIGWTNANLSAAQSSSPTRNNTGSGNWTIPATVPANAGNGLTTGATIDEAFLLAQNPGLTITQIDNAMIPRLGRAMESEGERNRVSGIMSLEWRPTPEFSGYFDTIVGKKKNELERSDMNWVGRFGASIPINMKVTGGDCAWGCVATQGTFANAQFFLEYRPYTETTDFWSVNPGFEWRPTDRLTIDTALNATKSKFHRQSPTFLVNTPASSGLTVPYNNTGAPPIITSSTDLNNPANFVWAGGRVNVQEEKRIVETKGLRSNLTFDLTDDLALKGGFAYDDVSRRIKSLNNDAAWQNAICGANLNVWLPAPNSIPGALQNCTGTAAAGPVAAGTFPGYGTGYTAGKPVLTAQGPLIPQSALASFLHPDPRGFVGVDWARLAAAGNFDFYHANAPETNGNTNTGTTPGYIQEKITGLYAMAQGRVRFGGEQQLRYDAGVRYVRTEQTFATLLNQADPRNAQQALANGGLYPNILTERHTTSDYNNVLPAGTLAFNFSRNLVGRLALSKTMTRPDPTQLRELQLSFSDPSAANGTLTNPDLEPYESRNIDLGLEYYTGREGYVAGTMFRKKVEGFTANRPINTTFGALAQYGTGIAQLTNQQCGALAQRAGQPAVTDCAGITADPALLAAVNQQPVIITQLQNFHVLTIRGFELTAVQPLDFLPVKGFGVQANYTRVKQSSTDPNAMAFGVAPHTYNLVGYYENRGIMLRISHTFTKGSPGGNPSNGLLSAPGVSALFYNDDYKQTDLAARWDIGSLMGMKDEALQLTLDIANLTESKQRQYVQFKEAAYTLYDPGRTYVVGVRAKF